MYRLGLCVTSWRRYERSSADWAASEMIRASLDFLRDPAVSRCQSPKWRSRQSLCISGWETQIPVVAKGWKLVVSGTRRKEGSCSIWRSAGIEEVQCSSRRWAAGSSVHWIIWASWAWAIHKCQEEAVSDSRGRFSAAESRGCHLSILTVIWRRLLFAWGPNVECRWKTAKAMLRRCLLWTDREEVDGAFFSQLEEASCYRRWSSWGTSATLTAAGGATLQSTSCPGDCCIDDKVIELLLKEM